LAGLSFEGNLCHYVEQVGKHVEVEHTLRGAQLHVVEEITLVLQSNVHSVLFVDSHELMSRDYVASNVAQALIPQSIQFLRVKIIALDNSGHSSEELVAFLTVYMLS